MTKTEKQPEYFQDRQAVADYLGVSRMTIHRWEKKARLNEPIGWGHTRYIKLDRVKEWLKEIHGKGIYPQYGMHKVSELMYSD